MDGASTCKIRLIMANDSISKELEGGLAERILRLPNGIFLKKIKGGLAGPVLAKTGLIFPRDISSKITKGEWAGLVFVHDKTDFGK